MSVIETRVRSCTVSQNLPWGRYKDTYWRHRLTDEVFKRMQDQNSNMYQKALKVLVDEKETDAPKTSSEEEGGPKKRTRKGADPKKKSKHKATKNQASSSEKEESNESDAPNKKQLKKKKKKDESSSSNS